MSHMRKDYRHDLLQRFLINSRRKLGLTQQEVADRLGKPQSFISKYESGERRLDVVEFVDVCQALAIAPSDFFKKLM